MLINLKDSLIDINPQDVLQEARDRGMEIETVEDFRDQADNYDRIEELMEGYRLSHARWSSVGGLTTGIGGFSTAVTFATLDTASLAIQLYRLAQQFAVLNGFDGRDPLQKDTMMNIYFEALAINGVAQATLKYQLLRASTVAGSREVADNFILKVIAKIGKVFGKRISSKQAGRLVPVIGGLVGASANYTFARKTSKSMKDAYKRAYFETWHDEEV
ncbi:EcsC family protein [Fodinibius sp.]|uniref:EcsC family protein n=1 Tax=Fodinibius sp. TaxID=1872440 RepID=UPI003564CA9E